MREIKFRAWDKFHKKMLHEGDRELEHYALTFDGRIVESADTDLVIADGAMFFLKLMQYTGLKDKNGLDVYEGDLIRDLDHPDKPVYEIAWSDVETEYYRKPPYKHDPDDYPWKRWYAEESEVIGNIYENPEPLT